MSCRRCLTQQTNLSLADDEVRRLARQMARTTNPTRLSNLKDQVVLQKMARTEAREAIEQGHECDTRLTDEHWTRKRLA